MKIIKISEHAYQRIKERMGVGRKAAIKIVEDAFEKGITHAETNGRLRRYIDGQAMTHLQKGIQLKIYGGMIYCFVRDLDAGDEEDAYVLQTVLFVPDNLKWQALVLQFRKKKGML